MNPILKSTAGQSGSTKTIWKQSIACRSALIYATVRFHAKYMKIESMKIKEKTGGAAGAFASSVSWSEKYLEEQEFQKVIADITFDEDFQKMHADDEGWRTGQKIAKRWYEMKYHALEARNETDLKRYRTTRMEWARAGISDSDMESDEIESYIKNVCQYEQGSIPALREEADPYTGILSADKRRQIREKLFFFDVVQANGGIRESDAREYMRMLPAQL